MKVCHTKEHSATFGKIIDVHITNFKYMFCMFRYLHQINLKKLTPELLSILEWYINVRTIIRCACHVGWKFMPKNINHLWHAYLCKYLYVYILKNCERVHACWTFVIKHIHIQFGNKSLLIRVHNVAVMKNLLLCSKLLPIMVESCHQINTIWSMYTWLRDFNNAHIFICMYSVFVPALNMQFLFLDKTSNGTH